ncbi:conserved Plasmodium protein, unknown function [Plasmodium ovale curtisi]|uniref:RNA-editing substrate-binding complex 6 protein domain-containing protein n=1 Tax=Plasmodium ovale curtisi TaxID=864141 RepID=A0A1A8XEH1_PLAOA|nr:conserved Plasmodium protein, unknown function [Plasmodium ovale curtisi]SBT02281.1 conserved Plasmodium protein, unknown function [Plasmodium ovale curtisi]
MLLRGLRGIVGRGSTITGRRISIFEVKVRGMKNKRRGLKEQPRKKPLDIEKKIRNPDKYEEKMHFDNLSRGELYIPESCKAKKLAMLCNRLYYFNINDDELLDRYAQRAIVIANSMSTKEMSLILNTMRRFNHRNVNLLEIFAKYIPKKLHKGVPQDISLILNAYAHFNFIDNNLFSRICEEIPHKIPYFQHSHIASVMNAFYKLNIKDKIIIYDMLDEVIDRTDEFDSKSLTNVINCLSKINYKNVNKNVIWTKMFEAVKNLRNEFNFLEIVLIINAFCKKKMKNQNVYNFLNDILSIHIFEKKSLNESNSFLLCTVANSFATTKFYSNIFFDFLLSYFSKEKNYESLDTQHFSQLIYSVSIFHLVDNKIFFTVFIKMVSARIEEKKYLSEQTLSTIAYAFAKLKIRDTSFFVLLSSHIIKDKIMLSPQSLSLLCYSYSKLKIKSEMLFYILSMQIFQKMNMFTIQGLSIILSSYANLKILNVKLFSLINKYLNLYFDNFTIEECQLIYKHYEHTIKSITGDMKKNDDSGESSLVCTANTVQELSTFAKLLRSKVEHLVENNKAGEKEVTHMTDVAEDGTVDAETTDDSAGEEESFFSIFTQNDLLSDESKNDAYGDDEDIETARYLLGPENSLFNNSQRGEQNAWQSGAQCKDDIKKKEETMKMYEKMFLADAPEGISSGGVQPSLVNSKLNENIYSILNSQKKKTEERSDMRDMNKDNISTKSLLGLMTSNKPSKINYEKENLVKSAEQIETEFIKAYVGEKKESNQNDKMGRNLKKRKKKIQNILSKKYEPMDNLTTLQEKWNTIYKNDGVS